MQMTSEQAGIAWQALAEKWPLDTRSCSVCKASEFLLHRHLYVISEYGTLTIVRTSSQLAFVVMKCKNCGHSLLFNAVDLGVLPAA